MSNNSPHEPSHKRLVRPTFLQSHVGHVRTSNEDACAVSEVEGTPSKWSGVLANDGGWALLADGLGGHAAGEVASSLALAVMRPMMSSAAAEPDLRMAVERADAALYLAMELQPALRGMGTTIAGVLFDGSSVLAFNLGDSRIYAWHGGKLTQLSTDDAIGGNMLTQCIGGSQEKASLTIHFVRPNAYSSLVLCSDGLSDMLSHVEIAKVLAAAPENPADALVGAALKAGGHDNVSVIYIGEPASIPL